ncbi:hypothetical protein FPCIR_6748 [Fusarium pseudocircinatum]|uniref:Uncharacterized protein n=1 Tax=Fusarium pseudocircinatum TaxID=56676 RepID=A0A8H5LAS3_9HYPO|nr:hypothetical protein FPCIR_6748 [Fusarium pseudocircinatum]
MQATGDDAPSPSSTRPPSPRSLPQSYIPATASETGFTAAPAVPLSASDSHDLKNAFSRETLQEALGLFQETVLQVLDPVHLDIRSCWLDIGFRDHAACSGPQAPSGPEPCTLLWNRRCHDHLHEKLSQVNPSTPLEADYFQGFLLRDIADYQSKATSIRASNPGRREQGDPSIIRFKAYNCIKEQVSVMFNSYNIFRSGYLLLLALNKDIIKSLSSMSEGGYGAPVTLMSRCSLLKAWKANKRHVRAISDMKSRLFCRLLMHCLHSERRFLYDNWNWQSRWAVKNGQKRRSKLERRGLGIGDSVITSGMPWIPQHCMDWSGGHIALETLVQIYLPRNPVHIRFIYQPNVQFFTANKVSVAHCLQQWVQEARLEFGRGHRQRAEKLVESITRLAVEEVARAYHLHMLSKVQQYWSRVLPQKKLKALPYIRHLRQSQEESVTEVGRIVTAQTIWEIYDEAWRIYSDVHLGSPSEQTPAEIPCWKAARKLLPPADG